MTTEQEVQREKIKHKERDLGSKVRMTHIRIFNT